MREHFKFIRPLNTDLCLNPFTGLIPFSLHQLQPKDPIFCGHEIKNITDFGSNTNHVGVILFTIDLAKLKYHKSPLKRWVFRRKIKISADSVIRLTQRKYKAYHQRGKNTSFKLIKLAVSAQGFSGWKMGHQVPSSRPTLKKVLKFEEDYMGFPRQACFVCWNLLFTN